MNKKLIEVALPLEKINEGAEHEKSVRHAHPSNLHQWWARRPFTAARSVIWASIIDDPSSHPELYPTEAEQNKERQRLFSILEKLSVWENTGDTGLLQLAKKEIFKATDGNPPALLDPFAGGGSIPFEAQRLGLKAYAHDLNPVAVMINKGMLEIPARFSDRKPVNPDARLKTNYDGEWKGVSGLAEDLLYYGMWMKEGIQKKLGHLYPRVNVPREYGGGSTDVIAWLWSRSVKCENPVCGCEVPLASSFVISKAKGNEAWVEPVYENNTLTFKVHKGKCPKDLETNKQGRSALFKCPVCGQVTADEYVKQCGKEGKISYRLMAIAGEGSHGRIYASPCEEHILAADVERPDTVPSGALPENPRWFSPPAFGMTDYADLFTNRQLTLVTTFSDYLEVVQEQIIKDAICAGVKEDHISIAEGGSGATAYAQAVIVYLAFAVDKMLCLNSNLTVWKSLAQCPLTFFGRQAIPMGWDFAESNPFSHSSGSFEVLLTGYVKAFLSSFSSSYEHEGVAQQNDAQSDCGLRNVMISTDPPYYDNIGYADLSDFFYVWLRQSLKKVYPELFPTMLTPKAEELVATPYHFGGSANKAKQFFEDGMLSTCKQLYKYANEKYPVTIYYAYKQSESDTSSSAGSETASTGWETMLSSIINAGFSITGTWPMRTERTGRMISNGTNALASSIVLVCRKRPGDAPVCTRRNFINELKRELRPALQKLQSSNIAPVDLAQSAIGPGMGVYSKYSQVLEADGTPMTVRSALKIINQELDLYFNEQDGELDSESRFCVDLYSQVAFNDMKFGDANTLATAKNTSVAAMAGRGTVYAQKGVVHLVERAELPEKIDEHESSIWLLCQQLTHKMEKEGVEGCAGAICNMFGSNAERAKDLAYRLYTIAERKKWAQEAYAYNALVVAWPEIQSRAAELKAVQPEQLEIEGF